MTFRFERKGDWLMLCREGVRHSMPEGPVEHWRGVLDSLDDPAWHAHTAHEWDRVAVMLLDDECTVIVWNRRNAGCNHYPDDPQHIPSENDYLVLRRGDLSRLIREALEDSSVPLSAPARSGVDQA